MKVYYVEWLLFELMMGIAEFRTAHLTPDDWTARFAEWCKVKGM